MNLNKVALNGVEVYPFSSEEQLIDYVGDRKGILIAVNAEKILHATDKRVILSSVILDIVMVLAQYLHSRGKGLKM